MELTARRIAVALALMAGGLLTMQFGRVTAPVEDGAGIAWSLLAVLVTIAAASTAGGIDPIAVREWVVRNRVGIALLLTPTAVSLVLVAAGVREWAWLTDPTPVGALGLGLALAAVPLSRAPRRRPA